MLIPSFHNNVSNKNMMLIPEKKEEPIHQPEMNTKDH